MSRVLPAASELEDFRRAVRAKIERDLASEDRVAKELRAEVLPRLRQSIEEARRSGLLTDAWLFGSYAWGQPTERSDVDILAADCSDPIAVAVVVGRACDRDVHVIQLERSAPSLRDRTFAEGLRL